MIGLKPGTITDLMLMKELWDYVKEENPVDCKELRDLFDKVIAEIEKDLKFEKATNEKILAIEHDVETDENAIKEIEELKSKLRTEGIANEQEKKWILEAVI